MVERISSQQFHASVGVEDGRVLFDGAKTYFATGSFGKAVELIDIIGRLAAAANHHPDVDRRYPGVVVGLFTHEVRGISERDVALAQQVSIDALVISEVLPFWGAVLGYDRFGDEDLVDPLSRGPWVTFQQMDTTRPHRGRIHLDISVPRDWAEARITAALAAGGHIVRDAHAPNWWTNRHIQPKCSGADSPTTPPSRLITVFGMLMSAPHGKPSDLTDLLGAGARRDRCPPSTRSRHYSCAEHDDMRPKIRLRPLACAHVGQRSSHSFDSGTGPQRSDHSCWARPAGGQEDPARLGRRLGLLGLGRGRVQRRHHDIRLHGVPHIELLRGSRDRRRPRR